MAGRQLLGHELTHVVQQDSAEHLPRNPTAVDDLRSRRPTVRLTDWGTHRSLATNTLVTAANKSLQRYGHDSSCTATDLTGVVWPGDNAMRQMVAKAIRVLSASPIDPLVKALFPKYFMTATPPVSTILEVFNAVQSVITDNDYTYECEHDCTEDAAYVRDRLRYIGINPNLHLCINYMSGYTLPCNASLILHEMTHYASHLDDEDKCGSSCSTAGCPASLTPSDALDNTYSYANFAYELDSIAV